MEVPPGAVPIRSIEEVCFMWLPGQGWVGNEKADRLARRVRFHPSVTKVGFHSL